mmetsp:Transcript_148544/g.211019  ORF Transcript_148544/g.211019 Transcript_148544/m.211019 type:complete len:348 (-) Transcript_148544:13-1056(-)
MAETTEKTYPHKKEDIEYEQEIKDAIKALPVEQRMQLIAMNSLIFKRKVADQKDDNEIEKVSEKFEVRELPFKTNANELINGDRAAKDDEIESFKEHLTDEEKGKLESENTAGRIEEYWFKALKNCQKLEQDIQEEDHPLMKAITRITDKNEEGNDNFEITFHFAPNDYIENEKLTVKFIMNDQDEPSKTESDEVQWKEGKNLSKKTVEKKQRNKKTGKTRTIKKEVDAESLFNLFKSLEAGDEDDMEEPEGEDIPQGEQLQINFDVANMIREEVIPYHLEFYLGVREVEDYGPMGEFGDDDDMDDEDMGDDDDDAPPKKAGGKKKGGAAAALGGKGGKDDEKCKQQ